MLMFKIYAFAIYDLVLKTPIRMHFIDMGLNDGS
jgi:hypothetical protein